MRPLFTRTRIVRALVACATIAAVLLALALGLAVVVADRFIYYPTAQVVATPRQVQMTHEEVCPRTAAGGGVHGG